MRGDESNVVSKLVSRAFLASKTFAGLDEDRYTPERIRVSMALGQTLIAEYAREGAAPSALETPACDTIVGSITIFPPKQESPCKLFRNCHSFGLLAVDPASGRKGLGRRLIAAAEEHVRTLGADRLALSVTQRGHDLIRLYEALSYEKTDEFHWPGVRDPSWIMLKVFPT